MYKLSPSLRPTGVFGSTLGADPKRSFPPVAKTAIYQAWRNREQADLLCDRCASESAPATQVIVDPKAEEVRLFCRPCYDRMKMMRLTHREWRTFEASDSEQWSRARLTSVLAQAGLLRA